MKTLYEGAARGTCTIWVDGASALALLLVTVPESCVASAGPAVCRAQACASRARHRLWSPRNPSPWVSPSPTPSSPRDTASTTRGRRVTARPSPWASPSPTPSSPHDTASTTRGRRVAAHHCFGVWAVQLHDVAPRVVPVLNVHFHLVVEPCRGKGEEG